MIDINTLQAGMLIEAEAASNKPMTIRVRIDRTPWQVNDRATTLSDGRGVVAVFTDTIRVIPEDTTASTDSADPIDAPKPGFVTGDPEDEDELIDGQEEYDCPAGLCGETEECGCYGEFDCSSCGGSGEREIEHCCLCGGSPYCSCCGKCGKCVGDCRCPIEVPLIDGGTKTV